MSRVNIKKEYPIEPTSYIWHELFLRNHLPANGVVVEVAPGYEYKIGNALALLGFTGTIFIIEPDRTAARHLKKIYRRILPRATIKMVIKLLQGVRVGIDIPRGANVLVASHPFDDMVIATLVNDKRFFSQEKAGSEYSSDTIKKIYASLSGKDYARGIKTTVTAWKRFLQKSRPRCFIASQYPSHTLTVKGLTKRQNSGYAVLDALKSYYRKFLDGSWRIPVFGFKGDSRWWIVVKNPYTDIRQDIKLKPAAIKRLGRSIFVPQSARRLRPKEYGIVYVDYEHFGDVNRGKIREQIRDLAITLDNKKRTSSQPIITYADKQKDKTGISLSGNLGSGRAVYYGDRYNVLGIGRTTLCKSRVPSHNSGKLEIIGAMRRIIMSKWVNRFTRRAPAHPALIALKNTIKVKWNFNPVPVSLLVRTDDSALDRPTHVEQLPRITVDFGKTLVEYAKIDAEYFAYRILFGAWSTGNYSLSGHIIDLESASFVKYRGPYYTSSAKYPHNRFGYEALGFIKILKQLAGVKKIKNINTGKQFRKERREHLGKCLLLLLGLDNGAASLFFSQHTQQVLRLSDEFERLSKKINSPAADLNLYMPVKDGEDPSLLDMSKLFRNLARLYQTPNSGKKALGYLVRRSALTQIKSRVPSCAENCWMKSLNDGLVITRNQEGRFLHETKKFIRSLFRLIKSLDTENYLPKIEEWRHRLRAMNQDLPSMSELNGKLKYLAESYRLKKISAEKLGSKIQKLCNLPNKKH